MPIETPTGTLEVENAKFRASSVEATIAVGIGTDSNDAYPLQIFKETAPDIRLSEGSTLSSAARFYSNNSNLYIQTGTDFTSGSSGDVAFQTMGGQSTHMVIKSDGKIGVGTTDPSTALEVYSSTGTQLTLSSSSRYSTIYGVDDTGSCFFGNDGGAFRITTGGDTSGTGASEALRVLSSGNVGIGLTTPTKMLHTKGEVVVGTSGDNYQNELGSLYFIRGATRGGTGFGDRHHYISTVTDGTAGGPAGNKMLFYIDDSTSINGTSHVNSLTLTGSGNVGIGTSEPRAPLDVMGIPYGPGARPIFSAYESDEYSVTSVGYITLGNTFVNGLNCYNTSTGIFTAPVDGIYCFIGNCTIRADTGSGNSTWSFHINNENWNPTSTGRPITFQAIDTGTNHQQTSGALIWSLNKNDTVRIYASGVPTNTNQNWGQGYGRFLGFLLS